MQIGTATGLRNQVFPGSTPGRPTKFYAAVSVVEAHEFVELVGTDRIRTDCPVLMLLSSIG